MRTKNLFLLSFLALPLILASCGSTQSGPQDSNAGSSSERMRWNDTRSPNEDGSPRERHSRSGSWARSSSGSLMMGQLSPEDQAIFQQMVDARKSGNTQLSEQLQAQLQSKHPGLHFGRKGGSGSGATQTGSAR